MMKKTPYLWAGVAALATIATVAACGTEPTSTRSIAPAAQPALTVGADGGALGPAVQRDLARLRAAVAPYHRRAASEGTYTLLFMNMCMTGQTGTNVGGMGYHWVNTSLLDGHVDVETPEALLYEPEANGQQRLVAVEYVIPKDAWQGTGNPMLFGQELKLNAFNLYALHVWIGKDNPDGIFANWNPNVTCAYATP